MRPLGALPALCALTSRPSFVAQWPSMPSASTLRAELWVHRIRTCVVIRLGSTLADLVDLALQRHAGE